MTAEYILWLYSHHLYRMVQIVTDSFILWLHGHNYTEPSSFWLNGIFCDWTVWFVTERSSRRLNRLVCDRSVGAAD